MKILFDTNVILDVMLDRQPFCEPACQLLTLVEGGDISGIICATTVTTIHYLASKILGQNKSQHEIKKLTTLFEIASVNRTVIENALNAAYSDFEDSVIHQAARHAGAEAIRPHYRRRYSYASSPRRRGSDCHKRPNRFQTCHTPCF